MGPLILRPVLAVAVALGVGGSDYVPAAAQNTWSYTGSMDIGRVNFDSVVLNTGQVLVGGDALTTELYDPWTGTWTLRGQWSGQRSDAVEVVALTSATRAG